MKIAISAESTIDLTPELVQKYDVKIVPFTVLLGDRAGADGEITADEIMAFVAKNKILPKTSAVNEVQYDEHFGDILKNYDAIIHFSLSSEMSSAYNNAVASSKKFKNVYVIDSRSLSTGIALLAIYAKKLADSGLSADKIYENQRPQFRGVGGVDGLEQGAHGEISRVQGDYRGFRRGALLPEQRGQAGIAAVFPALFIRDGQKTVVGVMGEQNGQGAGALILRRRCRRQDSGTKQQDQTQSAPAAQKLFHSGPSYRSGSQVFL